MWRIRLRGNPSCARCSPASLGIADCRQAHPKCSHKRGTTAKIRFVQASRVLYSKKSRFLCDAKKRARDEHCGGLIELAKDLSCRHSVEGTSPRSVLLRCRCSCEAAAFPLVLQPVFQSTSVVHRSAVCDRPIFYMRHRYNCRSVITSRRRSSIDIPVSLGFRGATGRGRDIIVYAVKPRLLLS